MDWTTTRRSSHVGYVVQAIVNNLAPLLFVVFSSRYGIGLAQLGALASLNFGVQLATDLVAAAVVDRVGYRIPMVAAHVLSAAGLVALGVLPLLAAHTFAALCAAVVVYAVGGGLLEVVVSPVVEHIPDDSRPKAAGMALLHSFYCWGQLGSSWSPPGRWRWWGSSGGRRCPSPGRACRSPTGSFWRARPCRRRCPGRTARRCARWGAPARSCSPWRSWRRAGPPSSR